MPLILENGNYIKKLFSLEKAGSNWDEKSPFILKEIKIMDVKENNSRIIPIKILIEQNETYCLCINENMIIEEINKSNKENEIGDEIEMMINYEIQLKREDNNLEKLKKLYSSNSLNQFIDLYNSLSDKNIKNLIRAFSGVKKGDISTDDICYDEIIEYLKGKDEMNDLLSFFVNNEKSEGKFFFSYLKIRISIIEKNLMSYIKINNALKSEGLFQKIIANNILYLNDDLRIQYFYSLLNMTERYYNDNNNYMVYNRRNYNNSKKNIIIDRFKALNFKEKYNENKIPDKQLNQTIFGQLFHFYEKTDGQEFLREKDDRMFIVKLSGEGAIDQGGPYREILSNICDELQSDYIELFIKTPNNKSDVGELRDKYIVNPNSNSIIYKNALEFIGKLMVLAISTGETFNFNFHPIVWKSLLENKKSFEDYETIDYNFYNLIKQLEEKLSKKDKIFIDSLGLNFIIKNSNESDIKLKENGQETKVTLENLEEYINLAKKARINEIDNQIKYIKDGLYSAIGKSILQILDWKQLEEMVCGEAIFDLKDFKNHTECNNEENVIKWFWEWLENCKVEDKFKYLKFVTGRSRLPKSNYRHIINLISDKDLLPISHTCSSTLDLPNYDSKNVLCKKMQYVIENVTNISDS